ncbi:sigma-70 family RNA polymerase sigma factor [Sphingomonas sp. MMSM20]|uniref:RNA polymerase sigma factor n=1 Tax=Sphingomonas lycopersici TaxID=2951807 RepID=UPI0022381C3A|nr:sigma-70 family RNA polymerase sigma factor [Sphingomonas lycopersici]
MCAGPRHTYYVTKCWKSGYRVLLSERSLEVDVEVRRWRPALLSFFLKRVHDRAEAEDLTQETFARLFGGDARQTGLHSGYIFQVAANLLRDRARHGKVRSDQADAVRQLYGQSVDFLDPERIAAGKSIMTQLLRSLGDLPTRTRAIFILYRIENIEKKVIAESFGISPSAVEKHVARAMSHLMTRARGLAQ